jgi:hypothetical protein
MKLHLLARRVVALIGLFVVASPAAEMRTWMSRQGGLLEAELVGVRGTQVTVATKDGNPRTLKTSDLSLADLQYLVETGGADPAIIAGGDPGLPEKDLRLESSAIAKLKDKLALAGSSELSFELVESAHFLIASAGKTNGREMAETAERLWHGMAFQHLDFRPHWGDRRMLILLVEDRGAYTALGSWYAEHLASSGQPDAAQKSRTGWPQQGATELWLPAALQTKHNLHPDGVVFNITDPAQYRKPLAPFPTNTIAGALLGMQLGGTKVRSGERTFAILYSHAYFKEIALCGRTETHLLDVTGSGNNELFTKQGFEDGTAWAKTLRTLVRKDKVEVALEPLLEMTLDNLTPEGLVLMYSLGCYLQTDAKRLAGFAKLAREIRAAGQVPPAAKIAERFGFATVAGFEADWKKFILSTEFR